ncbi:prolipoprotein diacylglyceryl transferase [Gaopeijia maritima]|uniref:prolipoprotein diacylglyceryl transferase n=1 Tax=Gaopeijia maritima TaxID=3119007 RepID=UPI0032854E5E
MYPILFHLPTWVPFLGGQAITSFGLMMFLAFLTAGVIARAELERLGMDEEKAWDLLFMAVVGGIVGAKLYYVFLNYDQFRVQGLSYVFNRGGMVWYGGFGLAAILVAWEAKRSKLHVPTIADVAAPALALAYAVGRMGCFLVGDDYGRPTDSWVGIAFPNGSPPSDVESLRRFGIEPDPALIEKYGNVLPVHPTQLYEVAMSTVIFLILWRIRKQPRAAGWLFMAWLAMAGIERFIVEIFRAKDDRFFGALTLAQLISIGLFMAGVAGMIHLGRRGVDAAKARGAAKAR